MGSIKDFENMRDQIESANDEEQTLGAGIHDDGTQEGMGRTAVESSINDSKQLLKRPELYYNNPYYEEFEEDFKLTQNINKHHEKERKERLNNSQEKKSFKK